MRKKSSADSAMRNHPHPVFQELAEAGYAFAYLLDKRPRHYRSSLQVWCSAGGAAAGHARFAWGRPGWNCRCVEAEIGEGHPEMKVGAAMCLLAEVLLDMTVEGCSECDAVQPAAAQAMRAGAGRPFGDPRGPWHWLAF